MPQFFVTSIRGHLLRELRTVRREVEAYPSDESIWQLPQGLANSGGTLALHIAGNIQHFIGARLGGTGYVRDRAAEFARRDVSRAEILREIDAAIAVVEQTLSSLDDQDTAGTYPEVITGMRVPTSEYLIHLDVHLAYHLGQLDSHRRIVTGENRGVGAVAPKELPSAVPA